MTMYYYERNLRNIQQLADNTKAAALKLLDYAEKNKIGILIYETIRSKAKQAENVRKGASQTMKSYHIVGQALDFVYTGGYDKSATLWNGYEKPEVKKFIAYAKSLGFQWGGDWSGFIDKPHLEFHYKGYGTDTFGKKATSVKTGAATKPAKSPAKPKSSTSKSKYNLPGGILKVTKPLTKGAGVKAVQQALAAVYYYPDKGAKNNGIDGYYGPKTANAVKRFQLMHGLAADGIYGPKTKAKLEALLK